MENETAARPIALAVRVPFHFPFVFHVPYEFIIVVSLGPNKLLKTTGWGFAGII